MALPSQSSSRGINLHRKQGGGRRRRRNPKKLILILLVLATLGYGAWWWATLPKSNMTQTASQTDATEDRGASSFLAKTNGKPEASPASRNVTREIDTRYILGAAATPNPAPTTANHVEAASAAANVTNSMQRGTQAGNAKGNNARIANASRHANSNADPVATFTNDTTHAIKKSTLQTLKASETETHASPSASLDQVPASWNPPSNPVLSGQFEHGMKLLSEGKLIQGRKLLSDLLIDKKAGLQSSQASQIRQRLTKLNTSLVFSPKIVPQDSLVQRYVIKQGDLLGSIARRYHVHYKLLEQINKIDARAIWVGKTIKVVKGPFHVVIDKSDYRMDLFLDDASELGQRIYIMSFPIGLGESGSTPIGQWHVKPGGKVPNPSWPDPVTGKVYASGDPNNPIGNYWIGLEGITPETAKLKGYGIHGTTDPNSIGKQRSLGCIRMADRDLALLYCLLVEKNSQVTIEP